MSSEFFYKHTDVELLQIDGSDAPSLLQDILTAQIEMLDTHTARLACLLSPQGRILFDMMIIRLDGPQFIVITETAQSSALAQKLKLYKLRRDVQITLRSGWSAGHVLTAPVHMDMSDKVLWRLDERHPDLGYLAIWEEGAVTAEHITDDDVWQKIRFKCGIPQGAADLTPNRALMLEAGLHLIGGIDFDKGCYIGQEVTARTHYRGLVKRRIIPVSTAHPVLHPELAIYRGDKQVGVILSTYTGSQLALASIRLDALNTQNQGPPLTVGGHELQPEIPNWMMPLPTGDKHDSTSL